MEKTRVSKSINDIVGDNVKKLAQLFPAVVKDGEVDFEALKEELGQFTEVDSEKYELTWAGKKNAKKIAQEDVVGRTLKFIPKDSKNADTTENLYIEGDNLEVLKLLRQNYYGAIKMIYIDPPYNTGGDFVYNDTFEMNKNKSDIAEGFTNEYGEKYIVNKSSTNRFHATWISMMYSRLKIAKDLLVDEGAIFVHIDEGEFFNLKKILDEIYGENCFINAITIKTKVAGVSGSFMGKSLQNNTEYILVYCKNSDVFNIKKMPEKRKELMDFIDMYAKEGKSWKYTSVLKYVDEGQYVKTIEAGNGDEIRIYKHEKYEVESIKKIADNEFGGDLKQAYYKYIDRIFRTTNAQTSTRTRVIEETKDIDNEIISIEYVPTKGKNAGTVTRIYYKDKVRNMVTYLKEVVSVEEDGIFKLDNAGNLWDDINYNNLASEAGLTFPNGQKPIQLLNRIIDMFETEGVFLDFFSGSSSMAHAVMKANAEDGGTRRFIMIQIPELCEEKSEPYKAGYKNICEIGKERIRRAGDKIKSEHPDADIDIGFKVFRTADTNIKWNSIMDMGQIDIEQMEYKPDLLDFMPNVNDVDVVYELMLRQRDVPLSESLEQLSDIGSRTYLYASSYLVCLETEITEELVSKLAEIDPLPIKFIFRDSAFKDDIALKDETFRRLKALIEKNAETNKPAYTVEFI